MAALLWLLIPVVAGIVASVWGGWAARRRTLVPDAVGVAGYERFRAAMARTHGVPGAPGGPGASTDAAASPPRTPLNTGTGPPAEGGRAGEQAQRPVA